MSSKCPSCTSSVFPNDPQLNVDGFRWHKACAKCADCSAQITLSNFTKTPDNTLLCKTHYFKRFHEEGSYAGGEQFQRKGTADIRKEKAPGDGDSTPRASDALSTSTSTSAASIATSSTVAVTVSSVAASKPVTERWAHSVSTNEDANSSEAARPASERVVAERPALSVEDLKARRSTFGGSKAPSVLKSVGGGGNKCAACNKSLFPMDAQINLDGVKFHKPCAKCADCSAQITLSNFTKTPDNTLLCKIHYFQRFREQGQYAGGEQFKQKGTAEVRADARKASGAGDCGNIDTSTPAAIPAADVPAEAPVEAAVSTTTEN